MNARRTTQSIKILILLFFAAVLAACADAPTATPTFTNTEILTSTVAPTNTPTSTAIPSQTPTPTWSPIIYNLQEEIFPVSTLDFDDGIIPSCLSDELKVLDDLEEFPGKIILQLDSEIYLFFGKPPQTEKLDNTQVNSSSSPIHIGMSPSNRYFGMWKWDENDEIFFTRTSLDGSLEEFYIARIDPSYGLGRIHSVYWISDDYLLIVHVWLEEGIEVNRHDSVVYSLREERYIPEYTLELPGRVEYTTYSFSPDLKRVLYVAKSNSVNLYDLESNKILAVWKNIPIIGGYNSSSAFLGRNRDVLWADSGEYFFLSFYHHELYVEYQYLVDRDGEIIQIINQSISGFSSGGESISPDKHFLAFESYVSWMDGDGRYYLVLYSFEDQNYQTICQFDEDLSPTNKLGNNRLIWSPDGRYFLYGAGDAFHDDDAAFMIYDTYTYEFYYLEGANQIVWDWIE